MKSVLVLGAGGNAGRNSVKCFKKAGYTVVGVDQDPYRLELSNADHKYLDISGSKDALLWEIVEKHNVGFLHPQPDGEVRWLSTAARDFRELGLTINHHSLDCFANKQLCQKVWNQYMHLDFRSIPAKVGLADAAEFAGLQRNDKRVWLRAKRGAGSRAALPVYTQEQASEWINYWHDKAGLTTADFYMQEFLPGREFAVQFFFARGALVGVQGRERLRAFFSNVMPSGQSSTPEVAKISNDSAVIKQALRAITHFDQIPHGIYGVDLKESYRGHLVPTEVNYGRFYTTVDFFEACGVNFPAMAARWHLERFYNYEISSIQDESLHWIRGLDTEGVLKRL